MSETVFSPLKAYVQEKKIALRALSRINGIPISTLHRIIEGGKASLKTAKRICFFSNGELTLKDFGYGD
jgi:predicted transcriptional regulator